MIVYSYLPRDPRVRREASALVDHGYSVDVICLREVRQNDFEIVNGINIHRLNLSKERGTKGKYILLYISFFIRAFFKTNLLWFRKKYSVVHVHNMPDFLIFIPIIQKLLGAKLILDMHDPTPEVFMTKFSADSKVIQFLKFQEKISIRFADKIITTNKAFVDTFTNRSCPPSKINIVMNTPDEKFFRHGLYQQEIPNDKSKFIIMYHGVIVERHGLDEAVNAINILKKDIPEILLWVFGDGEFLDSFLSLVDRLHLHNYVQYKGSVPVEVIVNTIPAINLGIIPNRLGPFTNINFPTRIFEYLFFRKPVIVPKTKGILDYFDDRSIFYFKPNETKSLADVILSIYNNSVDVDKVIQKGYNIYYGHRWELQSKYLINMYKNLLTHK